MMTWNHLDSDLCQHVITLINRALDAPDGPHKGDPRCSAPRQRLVVALLDKGLMKTITDLQELVQESLFNVSCPCSVIKCNGVVHPAQLSMLGILCGFMMLLMCLGSKQIAHLKSCLVPSLKCQASAVESVYCMMHM